METHWTLGVLIGLPIALVSVIALLAFGQFLAYVQRRDAGPNNYAGWSDEAKVAKWAIRVVVVIVVVTVAIGTYPFSAQYHQWRGKSGEVVAVNSRILGSSDSVNQKFVIRFKGSQQEYGCDDTRCSLVKVGDTVQLSCIRTWQYAGTDGWDCNFYRNLGDQ